MKPGKDFDLTNAARYAISNMEKGKPEKQLTLEK